MSLSLHFVHGWGFDASFWDGVAPLLDVWPQTRADRGWFGPAEERVPEGPCLVIAHSHGALRSLLAPPPGCVGMIAINGFDRFGQTRVLDWMLARFADDPARVLDAFRARCGAGPALAITDAAALAAGLADLRDTDGADAAAAWALPLVSLQGGADPILPEATRDTAFSAARCFRLECIAGGGHLLPLTDPQFCAHHIRALAEHLS